LEIFSLDKQCCSTCEHWDGTRLLSECRHVYVMSDTQGNCPTNLHWSKFSDSCKGWKLMQLAAPPDRPDDWTPGCVRSLRNIAHSA